MIDTKEFLAGRNRLIPLARGIRAVMVGGGDMMQAHSYAVAKPAWDNTPEVAGMLERAITAPLSTESDGGALWSRFGAQINEALRPLTVFGRLQGLMKRVPFRTAVTYSADATEARFVGQSTTGAGSAGSAAPVTGLSFTESGEVATARMEFAKLSLISVHTLELVRAGPPGTDEFIAGELLRSLIKGLDAQFIDPSRLYDAARNAPASVTSAGTVLSSTGSTLATIDADLGQMVDALVGNGMTLETAHWLMSPVTATYLARLRGTGGTPAHPYIGAKGGLLLGLPVLCTGACAAEGSPGERFIGLLEAQHVSYADDDGLEIDYATNAALQMDDAPTGGAAQLRSLWQHGLKAVRLQKLCNFQARTGASAVLRNVAF